METIIDSIFSILFIIFLVSYNELHLGMLHPKAAKQYSAFGYLPKNPSYFPPEFKEKISKTLEDIKSYRNNKIYVSFHPIAESLNYNQYQDDSLILWTPVFSERLPNLIIIHEYIHGVGAADRIYLERFINEGNIERKQLINSPVGEYNSLGIIFRADFSQQEPNLYRQLLDH